MNELFANTVYFGAALTLAAYMIGVWVTAKVKLPICNPILVAMILCIAVLKLCSIDYDTFNKGGAYISWFLTPATICLAVPLYEKVEVLKKNLVAILAGIIAGVLTSAAGVFALAKVFQMEHRAFVSLIPKSITTAIGMGLSEELNGYVALTVIEIVATGMLGYICAEGVLKIFHITEPVAKGIGIGSASHAMGTVKAMEMGDTEGAMSGLSIALSGVLTVLLVFAMTSAGIL